MLSLAEENELLRYRVKELEQVVGLKEQFPRCMKLTKRETQLLGLLFKREFVSRDAFYVAIYEDINSSDIPTTNVIEVQLSHLRKKLAPFAIYVKNLYGHGWYLSAGDKATLKAMCVEARIAA